MCTPCESIYATQGLCSLENIMDNAIAFTHGTKRFSTVVGLKIILSMLKYSPVLYSVL